MTKLASSASLASLSLAFLLAGCASAPPAPKGADGKPIAVEVSVDGGWEQIDRDNPNHVDQRTQLVNYIKEETVAQLSQSGYSAHLLDSSKGLTPGARELHLRVENYNPGSAAARMLVGMGAGAATLDMSAVYTDGGKVLLKTQKSVGSSQNWRKIVRKINIEIMQEMAGHGAT